MRYALTALGALIGLIAAPLAALEIEERQVFPGTGPGMLRVLSTADLDVFAPFITAIQTQDPRLGIDYTVASSTEVHSAIRAGAVYDVVISSAMDLQFQLGNDGFAQPHVSPTTQRLPEWATWRDLVFAFTSEPAVAVISTAAFEGLPLPRSRQELITVLRENPDRFAEAVGTYDIRISGLGYLFATQEARISDAYWRLSEVMGRLAPRLYCCSGQMIDDVASGRLALAYNVLGSYAAQRLAGPQGDGMQILTFEDFDTVMLRTALIPRTAPSPEQAGAFLDRLLALGLRDEAGPLGLPPVSPPAQGQGSFGPIRLGPTLLVNLDPLNRRAFLESWENAVNQRRE